MHLERTKVVQLARKSVFRPVVGMVQKMVDWEKQLVVYLADCLAIMLGLTSVCC